MKKKIISVLSLIVALVMSFSLVGCNDYEAPTGSNTVKVPAQSVTSAINQIETAYGFKGELAVNLTSKATPPENISATVEKRGDKIKFTVDDEDGAEEYIFDARSGIVYESEGAGAVISQLCPANYVEYIEYLSEQLVSLPEADGELEYDANKKGVVFSYDGADTVNEYAKPLLDAYKFNKTVKSLIDSYLGKFTEDVVSVDLILLMADSYADKTVDEILDLLPEIAPQSAEAVAALRQKIEDYFIDDALIEAVYSRKLGEMVTALTIYIKENSGDEEDTPVSSESQKPADIEGGETGDGDTDVPEEEITEGAGMTEFVMGAINAMLFEEVDPATVEATLNGLFVVVNTALLLPVKPLIDKYVPDVSPDLYTFISKNVKVEKLNAEVVLGLKLDNDTATFTGVKGKFEFSHNYRGDVTGLTTVLADNNYKAEFALDITEIYTSAVDDFTISFAPTADVVKLVAANAFGTYTSDYTVKTELLGRAVTAVTVNGVATGTNGGTLTEVSVPAGVRFDIPSTSLVISAEYINSVFAEIGDDAAIAVSLTVDYTDPSLADDEITISVTRLTDDARTYFLTSLQKIIGKISSGDDSGSADREGNLGEPDHSEQLAA